jgi:prepilin-type N-terminal cleavage/methylation domain-containing protein
MLKYLRLDSRGGFSLIELIIVVAVIAILAAIMIPNFLSQRQRAADARAMDAINTVRKGLGMYAADNGSYPTGTNWAAVRTAVAPYISLPAAEADAGLSAFSYTATGTPPTSYTVCATPAGGTGQRVRGTPDTQALVATCP